MSDDITKQEVASDGTDDSVAMNAHEDSNFCKQFASELSRSLEYFQLQSGQNKPAKFLLDPIFQEKTTLQDCLSKQLSMPVEVLDIAKFSELKVKVDPDKQMLCLSLIGTMLGADRLPPDNEHQQAVKPKELEKKNEATS